MTYFMAVTQAPHASFHNGGSGPTSCEYWMRPTQYDPPGPRIDIATAGMASGEFRAIHETSTGELFRVRSPENNNSYDILDWTPRAVFDPSTQQIIFAGKRIKFKVIAYSDLTGNSRELPMPLANGASRASETGHWYGNTDHDRAGGVYLGFAARHFRLDTATETYTALPNHETTNGANGAMFAWSPDLSEAGGLVRYAGDAQRWLRYFPLSNSWDRPAQNIGNGMHALVEYQQTCQRFLVVGGTGTAQQARLVTAAGVATLVTSAPDPIAMSSGSWCVAHPSGCWLVTTFGATRKLWAVWPNTDLDDVVWQDLGVAPDAALSLPTAAWDQGRGLLYVLATTGLYAYKPPALTPPHAIGALDLVEATDLVTISGQVPVRSSLALAEAGDVVMISGRTPTRTAIELQEAPDVLTIVGVVGERPLTPCPTVDEIAAAVRAGLAAEVAAAVRAALAGELERIVRLHKIHGLETGIALEVDDEQGTRRAGDIEQTVETTQNGAFTRVALR